MSEAFAVATAFVDADGNHTDAELWALLAAFAGRLDGLFGLTAPDDLRRRGLVAGRRAWVEEPSEVFDLIASADGKFGTGDGWRCYQDAMALAYAVCAVDDQPSSAELDALDRFRATMLRALERCGVSDPATGSPVRTTTPPARTAAADPGPEGAAAAGTPAPPEAPARSLEELLAELDGLIGLAEVKTEVRLVANLIAVQNLRRAHGLPVVEQSRHLVFTGNPGTGKTTVALRMAQILHRLGYVRKGHLTAVTRDDLVGQYIGHTAPKTREVLKRALGGVLFIDEAYYLYRPENERDYGQEAIEILLQVMENQREDLVVILAGYKDRMDTFFRSNPGMSSRVAHHIDFPDYTPGELLAIATLMLEQMQYRLSPQADATLRDYIERRRAQPNFANARSVRNALDRARLRQASRLFGRGGGVVSRADLISTGLKLTTSIA